MGGKSNAAFPADEEEIAPLEEFSGFGGITVTVLSP